MESFEAHWGAPGGVVQTIVGSQLRDKSLPCPPRIRHELPLNDQGRAILYEIEPMVGHVLPCYADGILHL